MKNYFIRVRDLEFLVGFIVYDADLRTSLKRAFPFLLKSISLILPLKLIFNTSPDFADIHVYFVIITALIDQTDRLTLSAIVCATQLRPQVPKKGFLA